MEHDSRNAHSSKHGPHAQDPHEHGTHEHGPQADDHDEGHGHEHHGGHEHAHAHGDEGAHSPGHHGHAHGLTADGINARMGIAVVLNLIFVAIEGTFGFLSNSVALIADAGHNLGDVLGLVCAWTAMYLGRRPPGASFTSGLGRSSVLAALATAVLLLS